MTHPSLSAKAFLSYQSQRLGLRWTVIRFSVQATVFWTLAILAGSWLQYWHLAPLWWAFLVAWAFLALPGLVTHIQLISDVLAYAVSGKTYFFPRVLAATETDEYDRRLRQLPRHIKPLVSVFLYAAYTSPLMGVALWCVVVLLRLPAKAHAEQRAIAAQEIRLAIATARRIEFAGAEDWAGRLGLGVSHNQAA